MLPNAVTKIAYHIPSFPGWLPWVGHVAALGLETAEMEAVGSLRPQKLHSVTSTTFSGQMDHKVSSDSRARTRLKKGDRTEGGRTRMGEMLADLLVEKLLQFTPDCKYSCVPMCKVPPDFRAPPRLSNHGIG